MDDKYKTKAQLRAELALLRQWIHNTEHDDSLSVGDKSTCVAVLADHDRTQAQLSALISASRAVFKKSSFASVARSVFDLAKPVIGADNGFVALITQSGKDIEMAFIDYGSIPADQAKNMTLPVSGLREKVIRTKKALCINEFGDTSWHNALPQNHISIQNVLYAPLLLKDEVVGMLALANKREGFDRADIEIIQAFCELLSISLANTRAFEALKSSEERFRQFFQNEPNFCLIISTEGLITDVNQAGLDALGCNRETLIGKPWYAIYDAESQEWIKQQQAIYQQPFIFSNQPLSILSRQGIRRNVLVSMSEVIGQKNRLSHYITVQNDVTRQVRIEAEQKQLINVYQEQSEILTESNFQLEAALNKVQESELKLHELYEQEKKLHNELETEIRKRADFTRTLVHELKTPLVPLVASASLLSEGLKEEPWQSIAANIEHGAVNLSQRIDELLDVAKGEVGTLEVNLKKIHILPIIKEVVRQSRDLIELRKQSLITEIPDSLPPVKVDASRISQVITNVLNNASKYTPGGGTITLKTYAKSDLLYISVQDTGLGIPAEDQKQVFNSYFRASNSRTQFQGMGIGLYLCKKIMELHHGGISLESEEGKGSIFTLTLPLATASSSSNTAIVNSQKILVATNNTDIAEKLSHNIVSFWPGSETIIADSVQQIMDICEDKTTNALVLDLELPDIDGVKLLSDIKCTRDIPVIVLTSPEVHENHFAGVSGKADGIFIKPFDHKGLIKHLKNFVES